MSLSESSFEENIDWDRQIKKLINFCRRNHYFVEFTKNKLSEVDFESKVINIYKNHKIEYQFYILLHEIGHIELYKNKSNYRNNIIYGQKHFNRNSNTHKCSILNEEIFAWEKAYRLSKKLKLKIDKNNFEKFKTECIMSYIKFYFGC